MKISELKVGQGKVEVEATIVSVGETRVYNKFGKELKVAEAVISDGSGEIKLSLWNEDIEKASAGKTVKISNGYVSEFKGEKQLSAGKFGKLEVLG
jgi:replication factor A1